MATQLQIINLAFAHLSEPTVLNLGGDPKPPNVVKALAQWEQALDVALSVAPWLCATESRTLERDATGGDWRYPHWFTLPGGTLKVWNVEGGHDFAWQAGVAVGSGQAVTRLIKAKFAGPIYADLIVRRPAEALTPLLADALAWELAGRLAGPIQSSETKGKWALDRAEIAYAKAAGSECSEIGGQEPVFGVSGLAAARARAG